MRAKRSTAAEVVALAATERLRAPDAGAHLDRLRLTDAAMAGKPPVPGEFRMIRSGVGTHRCLHR